MRAANQKAGAKVKHINYASNFKKHWQYVLSKVNLTEQKEEVMKEEALFEYQQSRWL